ncbi:transcriptional regulator, tetR family [Frankia sp. EI5c]|uniref:TetR family transcriptional regulator n=1 Tax=Frankia sp. EI5c TaxID=683316 RepID=UPI0007C257B1|nr:TetR family transcriptional regulator [Frankia sp. EI5c]OAA25570.1 transcriptional regulator, tetR family [Frankia sp. EI5c]
MPYRRTAAVDDRLAAARERLVAAATELVAGAGWAGASVTAVAAAADMSVGSVYQHFPSKSALVREVFRRAAAREVALLAAVAAVPVASDLLDVDPLADPVNHDDRLDRDRLSLDPLSLDPLSLNLLGVEPLAAAVGFASAAGDPVDRLTLAVALFARRALARRGLAHALLAAPSDPAVECERLDFRRRYRDVFAALVAAGVEAGMLPDQDPTISAAALTGAIGEVLVGPISMAEELPRDGWEAERVVRQLVAIALRCVGAPPAVRAGGGAEKAG